MRVREKPKRVLPARRGSAGAVAKESPDESGAEEEGRCRPTRLGSFLLFGCALLRRSLGKCGRLLGVAGVLRFARLRLWWSECSLGLGQWVGFVFTGDTDVIGQRETQGEAG